MPLSEHVHCPGSNSRHDVGSGADGDPRGCGLHQDPRHALAYLRRHSYDTYRSRLSTGVVSVYCSAGNGRHSLFLFLVSTYSLCRVTRSRNTNFLSCRVMMAEPADFEIIAGVGNEVFYFFGSLPLITSSHHSKSDLLVVVVLCILVLLAWSSTQVVRSPLTVINNVSSSTRWSSLYTALLFELECLI